MRSVIIDDEPVARKVLRDELELIDSIEVVSEAENGAVALEKISALNPDLIFLDIQMPVMGGFELLDRLDRGHLPAVIMVTAYDEHAIRAFEAGALDYLLKPISQCRLLQAVERVIRMRGNAREIAENVTQLQQLAPMVNADARQSRKVIGKIGEEYFLLKPEEIFAFQATGDLVWIITAQQRYAATQNLRTLESRLKNSSFRRIHRNAIVNIDQVHKMSMMTSHRWLITLNNGDEFIVSKRQAQSVRDILHW